MSACVCMFTKKYCLYFNSIKGRSIVKRKPQTRGQGFVIGHRRDETYSERRRDNIKMKKKNNGEILLVEVWYEKTKNKLQSPKTLYTDRFSATSRKSIQS